MEKKSAQDELDAKDTLNPINTPCKPLRRTPKSLKNLKHYTP